MYSFVSGEAVLMEVWMIIFIFNSAYAAPYSPDHKHHSFALVFSHHQSGHKNCDALPLRGFQGWMPKSNLISTRIYGQGTGPGIYKLYSWIYSKIITDDAN